MIFVLSGGDSGATLVVTGVAGDTCTITNGTETYTKTFGTDKKATFEGLATGTWTVKMTNGTNTATRTITITADYAMSIAYFSASISVTYPAKSTCVIKNSSGTQVGSSTNTTTTPMTWTVTVDATGTYTITATATDGSGKTKSTTVSITAEGQAESVTLVYEFVLFDSNGWASKYANNVDYLNIALTPGTGLVSTYNVNGNTLCSKVVIDEVPNFNTLQFVYSGISSAVSMATKMGLNSTSTILGLDVDIAHASVTEGSGTATVDISGVNSPCYLRIAGAFDGTISEIRLR